MDQDLMKFLAADELDDWSAEAASVQLVSPLKLFQDWYERQPSQVADAIAREARGFLASDSLYQQLSPGMTSPLEIAGVFVGWLQCAKGDPHLTFGRTFILLGMVDTLTFQYRATPDDWMFLKEQRDRRRQRTGWKPPVYPINVIPPTPEQEAELERGWIRSAASWSQMRNSVLGNEALAAWFEIACWQQP